MELAKDQDRRRICGVSPLYSLIHLAVREALVLSRKGIVREVLPKAKTAA